MFIIDEPYISAFLIETIQKNHFRIVDTQNARKLIGEVPLKWVGEREAVSLASNKHRIYTNSENALSWVGQNLPEQQVSQQIRLFKDKFAFREEIRELFPDFFFKTVKLEEIPSLSLEDLPLPFVIKPQIGFFSIGVFIIKEASDWELAKKELQPEKLKNIFPPSVLNTSTFIIEEFIEGEEYAIDFYFNDQSEAVVLNILHHLFSSGTDTRDRVYTTSREIIASHKDRVEAFLSLIGKKLDLKNFPAHVEVRIDSQGKIVPIEVNPLRFGGWCTTADLLGVALGFNSYEYFFQNQKPDWESIFADKADKQYSIIVLDNSSGIDLTEIERFDYEKLAQDLENPVLIRRLDINQYPVFGFVFAESSTDNTEELLRMLNSDFREYIVVKVRT